MQNLFTRVNLLIFFLIISFNLWGIYPEISTNNRDILYKQLKADILENSKRIIENKDLLPIQFYKYTLKENDSIFTVSARFNLSYDTIATLNSIENQLFFSGKDSIIIPNCHGIYLKESIYKDPYKILVNNEILYFYPKRTFTGKERLDFLITPFASPLKIMKITSDFGYRENPFTKNQEFHSGLDLKAIIGTPIYSPYNGIINNIGYSEFYGNYLIIVHTDGYSSHYYHLKNMTVKEREVVNKGDIVARTGNSGKSTGPHLHFEIHKDNEPINPKILLGNV